MVTGALPYYKEAAQDDPIYKFMHQQNSGKFWHTWRKYRDPSGEYYTSEVSSSSILYDVAEFSVGIFWGWIIFILRIVRSIINLCLRILCLKFLQFQSTKN